VTIANSCQEQSTTSTTPPTQAASKAERVGGPCECCEGIYEGLPTQLDWQTALTDKKEPRERLQIRGKVYKKDGKTPASNVILYVYHTDARGFYSDLYGHAPQVTNQTPCATRHGHLRGWMKTDEQGRYFFQTIRPAAYPNRDEPAHIHMIVKEEGLNEYYVSDFLFSDDPLLREDKKRQIHPAGGPGLITLSRDKDRGWTGQRDIILGLHISHYPQ
jgi:protocatechuate 3,4-dioxygenase beta subunit